MIYLIRTIFISRDAADVKNEAAGHRNVQTNLSFVRTVLKITVAKNAPNRRNYVPTAVKQVITLLQGHARKTRTSFQRPATLREIIRPDPSPSNSTNKKVASPLEAQFSEFTAKVIKMVDLRINTAIQHLETRLSKHFESMMTAIQCSLNRVESYSPPCSIAPKKRVKIAHTTDTTIDSSTDIDMADNEMFVKRITAEQTKILDDQILVGAEAKRYSASKQKGRPR
ncbi:hypothetical protein ACOME3_004037 [Neoechinorhynchus agilis]